MKICHVITRLIVGGAQENTVLSCEGLVRRGHDVTLVAGPETGPEGSLWEQAAASGAGLVGLNSLRRRPRPWLDWRCVGEVRRVFRDGGFDVVHTHSSKAGILGREAARRAGVPVVVHTIHGMSFNRTQGWLARGLYRWLERRAAGWTDAFVTVADAMADQAVAARLGAREKFTTIYSGMRTEAYLPDAAARRAVRAEWGVDDSAVVVGTIARLFRNKGYEELLAAMPFMVARVPGLRFVWVGDGAGRGRYVAALERMGLRDRVILTGLVRPGRVPGLVAGLDVMVHASRWEGLARALVQGMLMEVPGVSFDNDGAPEVVVEGETGRLVRYGDVRGLADAVVELAGSVELRRRMGAEGRRRCLERFSAERMVGELEGLYGRLLATRGCA